MATTVRPSRTERVGAPVERHNGHRTHPAPSGWLAGLRIATGFVFLWAFFDKLVGLGYSTPSDLNP